jgi:hypothetical protein
VKVQPNGCSMHFPVGDVAANRQRHAASKYRSAFL